MSGARPFITGATGFLGSEFLRRLLAWDSTAQPVLLVRGKGRLSACDRVEALRNEFRRASNETTGDPDAAGWQERVQVVEGDLLEEHLGLDDRLYDELCATVDEIWHFGADVRFDRPLDRARQIHVNGTLTLAGLARAAVSHGQFLRFHHVSTYAAGRRDDALVIPEGPPVLTGRFRNSYEQTKAEAEAALLARSGEIPVTIHRSGIVVGDSRTGWTPKFDVFYFAIGLLLNEQNIDLSRLKLPVSVHARVNAVAIDDVANSLFVLGHRERGSSGEVLHLTPGPRATPLADALTDGMRRYVECNQRLGRRAAPLPEIVAIADVSPTSMATALGTEVPDQILDMIIHIVPYFFDTAVWENHGLLTALNASGIELRPLGSIMDAIIDYAVRSNWGASPEPRPPLGERPSV